MNHAMAFVRQHPKSVRPDRRFMLALSIFRSNGQFVKQVSVLIEWPKSIRVTPLQSARLNTSKTNRQDYYRQRYRKITHPNGA